jgi:hypothetical protein
MNLLGSLACHEGDRKVQPLNRLSTIDIAESQDMQMQLSLERALRHREPLKA